MIRGTFREHGFATKALRRSISKFMAGKSVLELGCGEGHLTQSIITAIECLYYLTPEDQEVFFEKLAREHSGMITILSGPIIGENEHRKYFTHQGLLDAFARHGMDVMEFHNLNVYRTTALANIPAILVKLPLGDWLLDYLPSNMVYQRCYIIQIM